MIGNEQVDTFLARFAGRTDVHGTYSPDTGRSWQVKKPVSIAVVRRHLQGTVPLGVYPLVGERVFFSVADFDSLDTELPSRFCALAKDAGVQCYLERSKSKGFHAWWFFESRGVEARLARRAMQALLREIGAESTEVFPKQDRLLSRAQYGNFINLPLFGRHVPEGRTVFVDENMQPIENQWGVLEHVQPVTRESLVQMAGKEKSGPNGDEPGTHRPAAVPTKYDLKPCAERMLKEGVADYQRVACFRLAVQLKLAGYSYDQAIGILGTWAQRNRPPSGKSIIRESEVHAQTRSAYQGNYRGMGCEDPAVTPFCDSSCPIFKTSVGVRS